MSKERVIKFRCWDKSAECFRDEFKMSFDGTLWYNSVVGIRKCHQENYVLMQFTGLYDKEGKEIYEGDIVRLRNHSSQIQRKSIISEIGFLECAFCAYWRKTEVWEGYNVSPSSVIFLNSISSDQIEVIGSIYTTPLEEKV
jgi:uncharacterized phage protein (TIGR01671 family)